MTMYSVEETNIKTVDLACCGEIQQLLCRQHIPSAVYAMDGTCLKEPVCIPECEMSCSQWWKCYAALLEQIRDNPNDESSWYYTCEQGYIVLAVPLQYSVQPTAVLLCCLQNMHVQNTESLDRICNILQIDSALLYKMLKPRMLSAGQVATSFSPILQQLLHNIRDNNKKTADVQALSISLSKSYDELALLRQISDKMRITKDPQTFFSGLVNDLLDLLDAGFLVLFWGSEEQIAVDKPEIVIAGDIPGDLQGLDLLWHRAKSLLVENKGNVLLDSGVDGPFRYQWPSSISSILAVPLHREQKNLGAMVAINKNNGAGKANNSDFPGNEKVKPEDFNNIDAKLLASVGNQIVVYLENFRLYRDMQELLIGSLRALTSSIDAKDPYTCGHSERVALISRFLAQSQNLSDDQINDVYLTGLLHDVGKIGISESVLRKKGRLSREEYESMKKHPLIGADILSGIKQMAHVVHGVVTHHENYDGTGYPHQLVAHQIPLAGRIVRIADSFDAMINDRTYRSALPLEAALAEIRRFSGTQYDPVLADALLDCDIKQILDEIEAKEAAPDLLNNFYSSHYS